MTDISHQHIIMLLGYFPYYYTTVITHSRFKNITATELSRLSPKSKLNAEFLNVVGLTEIDFTPLKEVIKFVDSYLKSGELDKEECLRLIKDASETDKKMDEIVESYKDANKATEDGVGAPIWCFVNRYAANILSTCILIEDKIPDPKNKKIMRQTLNERKRQDPDTDPSKAPLPV